MVSCAQQTILTGGAKDNKPPKLVLDSNRTVTNFSENHLLLEFNENIQLIKDKRTFITNPEINNIELYNINGQLISTYTYSKNLELGTLNQGQYFLKFDSESGIIYKSLIVR